MKAYKEMLKIEFKLSIRDMNLIIFAILMPVVITLLIGSMYSGNKEVIATSFCAVSTVAFCAGGLMGLPMVIGDYRQKKILKRLMTTPIRPSLILLVHISIYAIYSFVSLLLVYGINVILFDYHMQGSWLAYFIGYILVMLSTFSIGLLIGGVAPNMKTANVISSLCYFPMLVLSGTTIPYEAMPSILQKIADILPLTQGIKILEVISFGMSLNHVGTSVIVMVILSLICMVLSVRLFRWE